MSESQRQLATKAAVEARRIRSITNVQQVCPIDPVQIAEACGCQVWFKKLKSLEGMYAPEPRPVILLGSERPAGRRAYNCCHELGHHVFRHGYKMEELEEQKKSCSKSPDEFLADMFAAFLLMPQMAVRKTIKDRGWSAANLSPEDIYALASYFGVGYTTIINHMTWTLNLISSGKAKALLNVQPREIKSRYGADPSTEVVFVDNFWIGRAVDLEVGDTVILPPDVSVEEENDLEPIVRTHEALLCRAAQQGITRVFSDNNEWAANVRVSRKGYDGLAQYRFLSDTEE